MVFHLIGIGLADEEDITLKGLRAVKKSAVVYIEAYTSILAVPREKLEALFEKKIEEAPREFVESEIEPILERARNEDVSMLIVGDALGATTHCDLLARAKAMGVPTQVVHNASIMTAVGCCGLQLYRYGETVSIPFFTRSWRPDSFYDKLLANQKVGLHTLALLDIKVREPTMASLARGKPTWLPPRFMSVRIAINQLLELEEKRKLCAATGETRAVGLARVGCVDQLVVIGTLSELRRVDFGGPLHSMVLLGQVGADEAELLAAFCTPAAEAPILSAAKAKEEDEAAARADAAHAGEAYREVVDDDEDEEVEVAEEPAANKPAVDRSEAAAARAAAAAAAASEAKADGGDATADDFLEAFGMD